MTVKVNKSKDYTISEIRSGFFNTVVSCIVVFLFGLFTILFNNKPGNDMSAFGFVEILFSIALLVYGVVTLKSRKKRFYHYMQSYSFCRCV